MKAKVLGNPDFGHVAFTLSPGDRLHCESGAMAHMSAGVEVRSRLLGGLASALLRKLLARESLLLAEYSSPGGESSLCVSPSVPGQIWRSELEGTGLYLQGGAYLASTPGLKLRTRFGGLRALFSGEGLFFLYCSGKGHLWINSYGSVVERVVNGELVVDTGHVVAWEPSLAWRVTTVGNLFSTLFSGEGLVMRFRGRGTVWLQTRSLAGLAGWASKYC